MIRLDLAPYGHECECCQSANYRRPGATEPRYPCAIYALTIGAGYRQPSYLCPNCLDVLRVTLGVKNRRVVATTLNPLASVGSGAANPGFTVVSATAPCVMEDNL